MEANKKHPTLVSVWDETAERGHKSIMSPLYMKRLRIHVLDYALYQGQWRRFFPLLKMNDFVA